MMLIRDLINSGISYYWINRSGEKLSPEMHSLEIAQEWHTQHLFSQYKGTERRRSIIDRRKDASTRKELDHTFGISRFKPQGRRVSDVPIHVDLDLATEKINFYKLI